MKTKTSRRPDVYRLLGLARRAGVVAPGTEAVRRAIREGEAQLILMATDASGVQLEKIKTTLRDRAIPQAFLGDRDALGAAVGTAPLSALAVTNVGLAERLRAELAAPADESSRNDVEA
jgi:ribosomal protein L7Ae-like RNA K-turn-binding protein